MTFSDIPQLVGADVVCVAVDWNNHAWRIQVQTPAGPLACALRIAGRHNVANALAAITCTLAAGVPISAIAQGLENFEPVRGRSRTVVGDVSGHLFTLIDDTYNANPDSVKAAIEVLASLPGPRLLVLGDMGEVGEFGPQFHEEAGAHAKSAGIEGLCTLGDLSGLASKAYGDAAHFTDVNSLNAALLDTLKNYRSVLVKGSRFMRMERVVNALAAPAQNSTQSSAQGATQKPSEAACC
jgi:UDP-N-acetylmuramoyl-tripeptide--D-alanyl-D-alanine ligase